MSPSPPRVVLDANVLYPFTLRDTLLRLAVKGYYQLRWSDQILDEMHRNLIEKAGISEEQSQNLRNAMTAAFPDAMVTDFESLIESMPNDEKDRHVAAAAVKASAQLVVTSNLRDFRNLPQNLEAQSPDQFLLSMLMTDSSGVIEVLKQQSAALKKPPVTLNELLTALSKTVPRFVQMLRVHL